MIQLPTRLARWAGFEGLSGLRTRREAGRSGVHRRSCCFACRETPRPQPPSGRTSPTGTAEPRTASCAFRASASHCQQGDLLTERPAENGARTAPSAVDVEGLHRLVLQSLDDDQALEVVTIPLAGKSNIADHMVVASGRSTRQVASMAVKLADKIKERFGKNVRIEGLPAADWVLIDADDVIVHIFRPEVRSFYNLERMWGFEENEAAAAPAVLGA